jgi:hypothetical protein
MVRGHVRVRVRYHDQKSVFGCTHAIGGKTRSEDYGIWVTLSSVGAGKFPTGYPRIHVHVKKHLGKRKTVGDPSTTHETPTTQHQARKPNWAMPGTCYVVPTRGLGDSENRTSDNLNPPSIVVEETSAFLVDDCHESGNTKDFVRLCRSRPTRDDEFSWRVSFDIA